MRKLIIAAVAATVATLSFTADADARNRGFQWRHGGHGWHGQAWRGHHGWRGHRWHGRHWHGHGHWGGGWGWGPGWGWGWGPTVVIGGPGWYDGGCYIRKVRRWDRNGNPYIRRVRVCR